jgi:hypothetical protein
VRNRVGKRVQFPERSFKFRAPLLELRVEPPDVLSAAAFLGHIGVHSHHTLRSAARARDRLFACLEDAHRSIRGPLDPELPLAPAQVDHKLPQLGLLAGEVLGVHPFRPSAVRDTSPRRGGEPVDPEHFRVPHHFPGPHGPFPNPQRGRLGRPAQTLFPEGWARGLSGAGRRLQRRAEKSFHTAIGFQPTPGPDGEGFPRELEAEPGFAGDSRTRGGLEGGSEGWEIFGNHPGTSFLPECGRGSEHPSRGTGFQRRESAGNGKSRQGGIPVERSGGGV